jgi:hypothetical protein
MANTVFVLGAGASKQAGAPIMAEFLDVANDLLKNGQLGVAEPSYQLIFSALNALQAVHSKSQLDIQNIESVFAAFEMANTIQALGSYGIDSPEDLVSAMKEVIVVTIQNTMTLPIRGNAPLPPEPYEQFAHLVVRLRETASPRRTVALITFNYDLGLDYALYWKRYPLWYGLTADRHPQAFPVMKLHGSFNWAYCPECPQIIPWHLDQYFSGRQWNVWPDHKSAHLTIGTHITDFQGHEHTLHRLPFVVPPTWSKSAYYPLLSPVWSSAAKELKEAENIIVIGYSLPESDYFFKYMYALSTVGPAPLQRFWVYNPDKSGSTEERFAALLGPGAAGRYKYFPVTFELAIQDLSVRLKVPAAP